MGKKVFKLLLLILLVGLFATACSNENSDIDTTNPYESLESRETLVPIAFTDISMIADLSSPVDDGWVHVEWIEGHSANEYYTTIKGVKPYTNLGIYADGETLVVFYDEGEGEKTDVELRLESLPMYSRDNSAEIIFILNSERSCNTKYTYGEE